MAMKKKILCKCITPNCGEEFYSTGHRKYCDKCLAEHQRENSRRWRERAKADGRIVTGIPHYKYTCRVCGTKTNDTEEICSCCKQKWVLCGIIVEMLDREKKKYGYKDKT